MYIELHARSAFSFLEGASLPEALIERAANLGMPSMALLDRNGLYGSPRFYAEAKKQGIRAHVGAEVAVADAGERMLPPQHLPHKIPAESARLPLLVTSRTGYQNLCRLITRYKLREERKAEGAATYADVAQYSEGLICLTGGEEGPLAAALARGGYEEARREIDRLIGIFGQKNVYVELQRHFCREEEWRNRAAIDLARSFHLPLLATNGVNYAGVADREIMDVLTCIRHKTTLDTAGRLLAQNAEHHLRAPKEMSKLFYDLPEAITNTVALASRLEFELDNLGYEFPRYTTPKGETMNSFLRKRVMEGVEQRYGIKNDPELYQKAKKQAEHELSLIEKLNLAGYFLIVWDIVQYCERQGILVQGRGSAANSVVCYALKITAVDPVDMDLLFERFLSEERGEWPDIDLDLPSGEERERAIQHVYQQYGKLGAAMCANVITYRGRSASREAGKVLGFDAETIDRLSGFIGRWEWKEANDTLHRRLMDAGFDVTHPRMAKFLEIAQRMQDLPRHLGQHSGGMVICQGQLDSVVPLEPATMPGRVVVQWDKEDCADMKIIKVDLLGLGMLAVMKDCLDLVPRHYGDSLDLGQIPKGDEDVYKTIRKADTVGMFQIESRAQMAALPRNNPEKFYDLVVQVAIIRPGPIIGKMMNPYLLRRQKKQEITYPHPRLESVLKRTLGIPLFQEQLIRIAMTIANFTGGEAEELRRAIGMRRSQDKMRRLEIKLRAGMTANNVDPAAQQQIVQAISSFALYGFPESHAASFALLAYASAYIKQHYLAAFTCATLNNQPMGFYSAATIVKDAQRHKLKVKVIDIQHSCWECILERLPDHIDPSRKERFAVRLGFSYARGLRIQAAQAIVAAREKDGLFTSVYDLARRVPELRKNELVVLAQIGALNSLGESIHRRDALWQAERAGKQAGPLLHSVADEHEEAKSPLFQMSTEERIVADFQGTGLTVGRHPMAYHRQQLDAMGIIPADKLPCHRGGELTRIAGCVIARQRPGTAKGFVFLSIEDETGISNAIIHPELFERNRALVSHSTFLMVEGVLQNQDNVISVKASSVHPLPISAADIRSHDFH